MTEPKINLADLRDKITRYGVAPPAWASTDTILALIDAVRITQAWWDADDDDHALACGLELDRQLNRFDFTP
jgi:hypothetical protein